jgi:hypothetical protein
MEVLLNLIWKNRGVRRGYTKQTTFLPALLNRTIVTEDSGDRRKPKQGCTKITMIGRCICSVIGQFKLLTA